MELIEEENLFRQYLQDNNVKNSSEQYIATLKSLYKKTGCAVTIENFKSQKIVDEILKTLKEKTDSGFEDRRSHVKKYQKFSLSKNIEKMKECNIENEDGYRTYLKDMGRTNGGIDSYCSYLNGICKKTSYQICRANVLDEQIHTEIKTILNEKVSSGVITKKTSDNYTSGWNSYVNYCRKDLATKSESSKSELSEGWENYIQSSKKLKDLMQDFNTSNIVGDFGEYLCLNFYEAEKAVNSSKSHDIKLGKTFYQVKTRKLNSKNQATQLGIIRSFDFHFLLVVLFTQDGKLFEVREIPCSDLKSSEKVKNDYQNGFVYTTTKKFLSLGKSLKAEFSEKFNLPTFSS